MISIIIPIYNEAQILRDQRDYYLQLKDKGEVIFVDGGSTDESARLAGNYGRVISSSRGRAIQKNAGAQHACGDMLLFLHVDTFLSDQAFTILQACTDEWQAGCFQMKICDERPIFRFYESNINRRAKKKYIIDGDLGLFVKKDIFMQLNGFKLLPIMDDIEFSERLNRNCSVEILPEIITVSARRWVDEGFVPTFWRYSMAYLKYHAGFKLFKKLENV